MAVNDLAPAFIKVNYTRGIVRHTKVIPTMPSGTPVPGSVPSMLAHSSAAVLFTDFIATWASFARPLFNADVSLVDMEFWSKPTPASDPIWIYTSGIGVAGSGTPPSVPAGQLVFTFRTDQGGLYRDYLMETWLEPDSAIAYPAMTNPTLAYANYIIGASSPVYGRDGGEVLHCLGIKTKTNDVLRRRLLTG